MGVGMGGWMDGWMLLLLSHCVLLSQETWFGQLGQNSVLSGGSDPRCLAMAHTRLWGLGKGAPLPTQAMHTHYWLALQSCLFQLAAPVTAHLVSPGGSMKWKFMFKFKNNILTLGASDVYIFNNLLRVKAWMSTCVSS